MGINREKAINFITRYQLDYCDRERRRQDLLATNQFAIPVRANYLPLPIEEIDLTDLDIIATFGRKDASMASTREVIISNGDTDEYIKLEFESWTEQGKILSSFFQVAISKQDRIFDFKRKCWFLRADILDSFLKGLQVLIDQGTLRFYKIEDKRIIVEDFEDFFTDNSSEGGGASPIEDKETLCAKFAVILTNIKIDYSINFMLATLIEVKPFYRKAALALHPDRNSGDGSKMSELNRVWTLLQGHLK